MPDPLLRISVIIVSYNTRDTTLDSLRHLHRNGAAQSYEVILVDNASTDGTIAAVRSEFPAVILIANSNNVGFGAANNQAMEIAQGDYLLLLNSDAFIQPGAIDSMVQCLESNSKIGVVGPRLTNADGSLQVSCFRYPSPARAWAENLWLSSAFPRHRTIGDYRRWPHDEERPVDWVSGACMLVRRQAYQAVGGFDRRFFMYAEETDWQARMRKKGWTVAFTPKAVVLHLGGGSGKGAKAKINNYFFESLDKYEMKHHGRAGLCSLRLAMIVGCFARLSAWSATWLLLSSRRAVASSKCKRHAWLLWRQATSWSLLLRGAK